MPTTKRTLLSALIITTILGLTTVATTIIFRETPTYTVSILNTYPHDPEAFTEGLIYTNGTLYESTGLYGDSTIRQVDLETGEIIKQTTLDNKYFGEGIAMQGDQLIQLTWEAKTSFAYDPVTLEQTGSFLYPISGWGLTTNNRFLIASDGSSTLYFINPKNFTKDSELQVTDKGEPVTGLNELEYVEGKIYANVFPYGEIAVIDPETGEVEQWIDLTGISGETTNATNPLNGIAYDTDGKRLFVTGKNWDNLYEINITTK